MRVLKAVGHLNVQEVSVVLINRSGRPVSSFDSRFITKAQKQLQNKGINLQFNTDVQKITASAVIANEAIIPSATKVWTAGIMTSRIKSNPAKNQCKNYS